jgi:hypothetical protein
MAKWWEYDPTPRPYEKMPKPEPTRGGFQVFLLMCSLGVLVACGGVLVFSLLRLLGLA